MKAVLVFTFFVSASYGSEVKWTDFRGGNVALPYNEAKAISDNWASCEEDKTLKITWYKKYSDDTFSIAFDKKGSCAGVRFAVLESQIESGFLSLYKQSKGIYEKTKSNGVTAYRSTVLFTSEKILKNGGRTVAAASDIAQTVYIKKNGKYVEVPKEGCTAAKTYTEQSCQSSYGLVFSEFTSKSKCDQLTPYYPVYHPNGNLIGFGWLSFHKVSASEAFSQQQSPKYVKTLFPKTPTCLSSCSNFAVIDVWLSYTASQETYCTESNWTTAHCKKGSSKKNSSSSSDSSDSDSSDSSDSSSDSDSS